MLEILWPVLACIGLLLGGAVLCLALAVVLSIAHDVLFWQRTRK